MFKNIKKLFLFLLIIPVAVVFVGCKKTVNPTPETYEISYELFGGINNPNNPSSYTQGNEAITLQAPSRDNYDFLGWFDDENLQNEVSAIEANSTGNKKFYAKWKATEFTLTYVLYGGFNDPDNPSVYTIEDEVILKDPSFGPNEFLGWYLDSLFLSKVEKIERGTTGNKTLYASWKDAAEYDITYQLFGGTNDPANPNTYKFSSNQSIELKDPSKEGYTFKGWYTESNFTNRVERIEPNSTGDKTFYAKWEAIQYDIVYNLNDGDNNINNPDSYTIESGIINLSDPSRFGYIFDGWFTESRFENQINQIDPQLKETVNLYAKWTPSTHKIFFSYEGATSNFDTEFIEVQFDSAIGPLPEPLKDDYVFMGWWRNNLQYDEDTIFKLNTDITLTAAWALYEETVSFTISFDSQDGTPVDPITGIAFGATIEEPQRPTKRGYIFEGWYLNGNKWDFAQNKVISNETLVANWVLENYEIEYVLDEGINNPDNKQTYTILDEVILYAPTRAGYDFKGWFKEDSFKNQIEKIDAGSVGKVTVYANWTKSLFTKTTANIKVNYNFPKELELLAKDYEDYEREISVYEVLVLENFRETNLSKYFLGYTYNNYQDQLITLEDGIYIPDSSEDVEFNAVWNTEALLSHYYTDGLYIEVEDDYAYVYNYTGSAENVYIPEYYNLDGTDYLINKIGESAFENNIFITKIIFLPRTETLEIGKSAFKSSSIAEFDFTYISKIGASAFANSLIKTVEFESSVIETESAIFENCLQLTDIDLSFAGPAYRFLYSRSFFGCTNLTNIKLPKSLTTIGEYAFAGCKNITSLDFLKQVSESCAIESHAFDNCTGLNEVLVPSNIVGLGDDVFSNCTNLKKIEITNLFDSLNGVTFAFVYGLQNIEEITISGDKVTSIPYEYFAELPALTKFVMSDNITVIEDFAFRDCSRLSDITLSKGLKLETFTLSAFTGTYWISQMNEVVVIESTVVYIPANENLTEVVLDNGVTAISQNAGKDNTYLQSIFIPNTVEVIGISAFEGCSNLVSVQFEQGSVLNKIDSRAFMNCVAIQDFSFENCSQLTTLGDNAIYAVGKSYKNVLLGGETGFVLPNSLESLGSNVFGGTNISKFVVNSEHFVVDEYGILYEIDERGTKIAIVAAPKNLQADSFYFMPKTITKVYDYAFYYTTSPNYVYIDSEVLLGRNAFRYPAILTGDNAKISYVEANYGSHYYHLTELEKTVDETENFTYEATDDGYNITIINQELEEGYYYIRIDDTVLLVQIYLEDVLLIEMIADITDYSAFFGI